MACAGLGPALAVSRLSRATRRSHGSLPQHVSRRSPGRTHGSPQGASERRDCERRDTLQRVKRARNVTAALLTELRGSPKRCGEPVFPRRRTPGPQRACALGWESERRVRIRPCGDRTASGRRDHQRQAAPLLFPVDGDVALENSLVLLTERDRKSPAIFGDRAARCSKHTPRV